MTLEPEPTLHGPALGTRHSALREWLAREEAAWKRAFAAALDDAIAHLQVVIFEEGWDELLARAGSSEAALRDSVALYERELAHLFGFVRASGAAQDAVAWSTLKADLRRAALEAGAEITLRSALETGMYTAEAVPLGDHALYRDWTRALMLFLFTFTAGGPPHPGADAPAEEQIAWAYRLLAPVEEHAAFHAAFTRYLRDAQVAPAATELLDHPIEEVIALQACLLELPRFDLILNTGLRWLTDAGTRAAGCGIR